MDRVNAEDARAKKVILEILPAGGTSPDKLVAAFEERGLKTSRDVIRGAIWSLLRDGVIETTAQGTLQRPLPGRSR